MSNLIKSLEERYTRDTTPDVATTVTQGLNQLSSGIYTEEERFVFELLQNAVDAYSADGTLKIKMAIADEYLVFMHNGDEFSERDIIGLCDIGNGNKMADTKKIGYKGIGFKSVFMCSSCVTVVSGKYCFKFDENHWKNYWKTHWKKAYGIIDSEKEYLMPWQIIPIETQCPLEYSTEGYNVATYIKLGSTVTISEKIMKLLSNSQFLLFLKSKNITVEFESNKKLLALVEKTTQGEIVNLSVDGEIQSQWLIYINNECPVPEELRADICSDINTPIKLKSSKSFDLAFAVALSKSGNLEAVKNDDAVIYTYLPTSFKFGGTGFPFLVNANFITDSGRQQLHKDSAWNKLIFSRIPKEFLTWVSNVLCKYSNYYEILPDIEYAGNNSLTEIFSKEMRKAISTIPFLPSLADPEKKMLVSQSLMDKIGISDAISAKNLVAHINRVTSHQFEDDCIIRTVYKGSKILESYGVYIFDAKKLKTLFDDKQVFDGISVELDAKLIKFLYDYYQRSRTEKDELSTILQDTKFLLDDEEVLYSPKNLFFPSTYDGLNRYKKDIHFLNKSIAESLNESVIKWLSSLGVSELSDVSFIKDVICKIGYITVTFPRSWTAAA